MADNHIRMLCSVLHTDLVYEDGEQKLTPFFDSILDSPLMQCGSLREKLRAGITAQKAPYVLFEENGIVFAALHADPGILFMGPMCSEKLKTLKLRQMYRDYGIHSDGARELPAFTLSEIRNMILLTNSVLKNGNLENEELTRLNQIIGSGAHADPSGKTRFLMEEEAENEDRSFRHSYHEEKQLMQAIREGRTKEAVRLAEDMDRDTGRLSGTELSHWRNLAIIGISLCTRAAIEEGISPEEGYRLSGYYIQKCDNAQDPAHLLHYRNRAIEELTVLVNRRHSVQRGSGHVELCKDYIRRHYREKIYLEDVADSLGLSPSYLSRLFKKETGKCLQDFINEERVLRAANLLSYSRLSLPEIADYVHFPNQSYFGKIFKQYMNMTPKEYRDRYTPTEILDDQRPR